MGKKLLVSEGWMHISKEDVNAIKKLDFVPFCKEIDAACTKILEANAVTSICKENKLTWFLQEVSEGLGITRLVAADVKAIMKKYLKIDMTNFKVSEGQLLKLTHDFFYEIAMH